MRHGHFVSLILFALIITGLATLNSTVVLVALPFLIYMAAGVLAAPGEPQLELTRAIAPEQAPAETPVTVTVTITNLGAAIKELHLIDRLPAGLWLVEGHTSWMMPLAAGASRSFSYVVTGPRGAHHFNSLRAIACEPSGLFRRSLSISMNDTLTYSLIAPSKSLKQIDIRPRRTRVYSGIIAARAGGEGTDFFGTRPYQHGDSLRRINWKATARHSEALFTNEFEQERVADVGLILDVREASNLPIDNDSLLDHSIEAAGLLAGRFLDQGDRVALLMYGATLDYTLPGYGKLQRIKIGQALARARLGQRQVFQQLRALPTRLFPPQSQVVFISPLLASDVPFLRRLRALGYQVIAIAPDPIGHEVRLLGQTPDVLLASRIARLERELLLRELRRAGVFVLDWHLDQPFDEAAGLLRYAGVAAWCAPSS